jgi:aquaporin Z
LKKYIAECIGTFFITLTLGISANFLAVGLVVIVLTSLFFSISGANFNPAITLALVFRKQMKIQNAFFYWMAQFLGAILATILFYFLFGRTFVLLTQQNIHIVKPLLLEIMFTYFIILTYLKSDLVKKYFLPGLAVMASGLTCASFSGGAFNPAIGIGPLLAELYFKSGYPLSHCVIYAVGPIVGCLGAVITDTYINSEKTF